MKENQSITLVVFIFYDIGILFTNLNNLSVSLYDCKRKKWKFQKLKDF